MGYQMIKKIVLALLVLSSTSLLASRYEEAEKLSRTIPIVSKQQYQQDYGIFLKSGTSINDTYATTYPIVLSLSKSFNRFLGVVLEGSYYFKTDSSLKDQIDDQTQHAASKTVLPEHHYPMAHLMLGFVLKPVYGKISFFSEKIIHFDLYFTVGGGATINTVHEKDEEVGGLEEKQQFTGSLFLGIGQNYFLTKSIALNLELFDNLTIGDIKGEMINQNISVRVGVQFAF